MGMVVKRVFPGLPSALGKLLRVGGLGSLTLLKGHTISLFLVATQTM